MNHRIDQLWDTGWDKIDPLKFQMNYLGHNVVYVLHVAAYTFNPRLNSVFAGY